MWVRPCEWLKLNFASCVVHQTRSYNMVCKSPDLPSVSREKHAWLVWPNRWIFLPIAFEQDKRDWFGRIEPNRNERFVRPKTKKNDLDLWCRWSWCRESQGQRWTKPPAWRPNRLSKGSNLRQLLCWGRRAASRNWWSCWCEGMNKYTIFVGALRDARRPTTQW